MASMLEKGGLLHVVGVVEVTIGIVVHKKVVWGWSYGAIGS